MLGFRGDELRLPPACETGDAARRRSPALPRASPARRPVEPPLPSPPRSAVRFSSARRNPTNEALVSILSIQLATPSLRMRFLPTYFFATNFFSFQQIGAISIYYCISRNKIVGEDSGEWLIWPFGGGMMRGFLGISFFSPSSLSIIVN